MARNRFYYFSIDSKNSVLFVLFLGMVVGSVLGLGLYPIFASPLFDIEPVLSFADDSRQDPTDCTHGKVHRGDKKWLKIRPKSQQWKKNCVYFTKNDTTFVTVKVCNTVIHSKTEMFIC
jgi:hypothetical protein